MNRTTHHFSAGTALIALGLCLAMAPLAQAGDADMTSNLTASGPISLGAPVTFSVEYGNLGPDTANDAYINADFIPPMGLDDMIDNLNNGDGSMYDALANSFTGDSNGNAAFLFWDDFYCEHVYFQLQGDNGDPAVAAAINPVPPGEGGTFTFDVTLPTEGAHTGTIEITSPANLAKTWTLTDPANVWVEEGAGTRWAKYATTTCEKLVGSEDEDVCDYITDNCWGKKVSFLDAPLEAEFVLVDDGSANPTLGCDTIINDVAGKIAVIERGTCEFGMKGFNAESAGAIAVFMINEGRCGDFPESPDCVNNMGGGDLGSLVTIPEIQISQGDGAPLLAALQNGETVMGAFGSTSTYGPDSWALLGTEDEDPDNLNSISAPTFPVSDIPEPPVASFTYEPAMPVTGSAVMFTDTSTNGPTEWAWDFGDGGSSTEQNPSYTFASAGTFSVMLTATNAGGSSNTSMDVTVTLGADLTESYFIPAAALAAGAAGSFFQTDVDINNAGQTASSFAFLWLPRGENNSDPTQSATFQLAAGASQRFENVLAEVFEAEPNVAGALAVLSNSADMKIMSRTYNVPTAKISGTFGQALPGIYSANLIGQNDTRRIIFMSENDDLRANLGCVNGVNDNVPIDITTYDATGAMLETQRMTLGPWSNNQINQILGDFAPVNGYADVSSIKANAGFYCYGSALDNGSNDPTSVLPTEYGVDGTSYFIPAAALAAGAAGSFFQTDVDINNAGDAMATYQFLWLPRGENNSDPTTSADFTLAAGASVRYENVLAEVFAAEPDVAGALAITSDSADLGVMSRTYNVPTAKISGTFGQAIPGVPGDNLIGQNDTRRIIFMSETDDLRANLGCVNGVNDNVPIDITTYDADGNMLETQRLTLGPWSNNQINQIFADFAPTNGYADVTSIKANAGFYCYGSVLDNGSNDPTTILPQ